MSYKGNCVLQRRIRTCFYLLQISGKIHCNVFSINRTLYSRKSTPDKPMATQEQTLGALKNMTKLGKQLGYNTVKTATAAVNYWWEKYEEFVGLNEVRDAQSKVTEAEKAFMMARGMVRDAHMSLEDLQMRLKEVRDRLDRVSREEAHYLELATLEHQLLQEERRLKTAYENAEEGEREQFALFSASVRESHEKERARAERTKNWSIIGSVLGTIIGVMGSTYINRVRLQELKGLLLDAQKGPASLQEAIQVQANSHKSQQEELGGLIDMLKLVITNKTDEKPISVPTEARCATLPSKRSISEETNKEMLLNSQKIQALMEDLKPQMEQIRQNLGKMVTELQAMKKFSDLPTEKPIQTKDASLSMWEAKGIIQGLDQTEKRLETQINKSTLYNTIMTYMVFALSMPVLYIIFKGMS